MQHHFQFMFSKMRFAYLMSMHSFALIVVFLTFSGFLLCVLCVIIASSAGYYFFWRTEKITAITFLCNQDWIVYFANHTDARATLLKTSVLWRFVMILHFQLLISQQKHSIVLFRDNLSKAQFCMLRRCVKMGYL